MPKSFSATLERTRSRLNWVIVRVPFDVAKVWGSRGQLRVKGTINGCAFRTSLFPTGEGEHVLLVNKKMLAGGAASVGVAARFRLEPDSEKREIVVPVELERALAEERALRRWFDRLKGSVRKWIVDMAAGVKSAEARDRRAAHIAEWLLETMQAERDLPPMWRTAFARNPQAYEGWKRMSPLRQRGQLLAVFYYRNPGSRARRLAKVLRECQALAEKPRRRTGDKIASTT